MHGSGEVGWINNGKDDRSLAIADFLRFVVGEHADRSSNTIFCSLAIFDRVN